MAESTFNPPVGAARSAMNPGGTVPTVDCDHYFPNHGEAQAAIMRAVTSTGACVVTGTMTIALHNGLRAQAKREGKAISIKQSGSGLAVVTSRS
ncbi:hypothetical protein ENKOMM257B_06920 [Enterobacter kobei]|uniref:hypothetical protein n=1 Tax=Enterobacter kobei TaxID=208224 RepID=UPI003B237C3B